MTAPAAVPHGPNMDPAAAPGVTAPVHGGWTTRQLMELIRAVAVSADVIGADFVEYNPYLDDQARTTALITNYMMPDMPGDQLAKEILTDNDRKMLAELQKKFGL